MKDTKKNIAYPEYYSIEDIYWSDLTPQKQEELKEAGLKETYILDDTIPLGQIDSYYLDVEDDYGDPEDWEEYYRTKDSKRTFNYPTTTSKGSNTTFMSDYYAKKYADDDLVLDDNIKAARRVYWLLIDRMPEVPELPSDLYAGDITEYLADHYTKSQLEDLTDLTDTTQLEELAQDIYEMFFKANV